MMLFITSWCKLLKTDPYREICTHTTWIKPFLPNTHPYMYLILLYLKMLSTNWGVIRKHTKIFFKQLFGCSSLTLTLNGMLNKRNCRLKMMLLHSNLAKNARVVSKLCSLLITTLTYHESKTWYLYEYN